MDRITLAEAAPTTLTPRGDGSGRYRALLIREGWGSSGYYRREVLERDGPKCWPAGTQNYLNHPSLTEAEERPERAVQDWASVTVTDPVWDEAERGLVADVEVFPQWRGLLNEQFAKQVGLSIRALGVAEHGEAEGRQGPIIQSLTEGISVDWVTRAGAGGRVLELIESARAAAPPAAPRAKPLEEAGRNIGAWFESRIHAGFTVQADEMYGDGRLTREERIALSSGIGEALAAFVRSVEAAAPQLFDRDLWAPIPDVGEVGEADAKKPPFLLFKAKPKASGDKDDGDDQEPGDDQDDEDSKAAAKKPKTTGGPPANKSKTPGSPPAKKMKETGMPELTEEQARQLDEAAQTKTRLDEAAERLDAAAQLIEAQGKQIGDLAAKVAESDKRDLLRDNAARARTLCGEALTASGLPDQAHPRVTHQVVKDLPTGDGGALDEAALSEAIKAAIHDEKSYLAALDESRGFGTPRGLGGGDATQTSSDDDAAFLSDLQASFQEAGLDESAAKTAAAGR